MSEFRHLLEAGDVEGLRQAWHRVAPHLPQPESYADAQAAMHYARTAAETVSKVCRLWSHCWLEEQGYPSALPTELRNEAIEHRIVDAVGVVVKFQSEALRPAAEEIQQAVSDAVAEAYAEGNKDPAYVQLRMKEARARSERALFGR